MVEKANNFLVSLENRFELEETDTEKDSWPSQTTF